MSVEHHTGKSRARRSSLEHAARPLLGCIEAPLGRGGMGGVWEVADDAGNATRSSRRRRA